MMFKRVSTLLSACALAGVMVALSGHRRSRSADGQFLDDRLIRRRR